MVRDGVASRVGIWFAVVVCVLMVPAASHGLILGSAPTEGNKPVADRGWPLGCLAMANLPTRIAWWEGPPFGGGESHFLYRGATTAEFNEALRTFASIRAPKREVVLHDGPRYGLLYQEWESPSQQPGGNARVDWEFAVWNPASWYRLNSDISTLLARRGPVPAPRLDVYLGGGAIVWAQVVDERAPVQPVGGGLVCGDVFDMSTGKPIAGAEVTLSAIKTGEGAQLLRGRTDGLGSFRLEGIPRGRYRIAVQAEGYAARQVDGLYRNRRDSYYQFSATLARVARIQGVVIDTQGELVRGAQVEATDTYGLDGERYASPEPAGAQWATTDEGGRFEIAALPTGFVHLTCLAAGRHQVKSTSEICRVPGPLVILTMEGTGKVQGKVVEGNGKAPGETVTVELRAVGDPLHKWGGSMNCAKDGSFVFPAVPQGEYLIGTDPGLLLDRNPDAQRVTVRVGQTVEVTVVRHGS